MKTRKKVLLVVIDALANDVIQPAIASDQLPTLKLLADIGAKSTTTAIFPSITPAATASIVTGAYPREHGIAGAYWWDAKMNSVAYFGADLWMFLKEGPGKYFRDFIVTLNERHLKTDPLFQQIEREGRTGAVINFMWFRGDQRHNLNAPLLLELLSGGTIPDHVFGPTHLALADFVPLRLSGSEESFSPSGGISQRYGFYDDCTAASLSRLYEGNVADIPDFTLAYFPNNDFVSHDDGPIAALETVQKVDQHLAELISQGGGLTTFLQDFAIVVCGDHSQSRTLDDDSARDICLHELLASFQQATPGTPWGDDDQLFICPNLRAAQIYVHPDLPEPRQRHLVEDLLAESRIDQVIRRDSDGSFVVQTADRGSLAFRNNGNIVDEYENRWTIDGDLAAIDARLIDQQIHYGEYPNALERIWNGFADNSASLWVTARLGHEFRIAETHTHSGGSHGSLHLLDSTSPLIAAGLPSEVSLPTNARTIDIAPLCRSVMGLN